MCLQIIYIQYIWIYIEDLELNKQQWHAVKLWKTIEIGSR